MRHCPNCGARLPVQQAKFCPECGAAVAAQERQEKDKDLWGQGRYSSVGRPVGARTRSSDPYTLQVPGEKHKSTEEPSPEDLWDQAIREAVELPDEPSLPPDDAKPAHSDWQDAPGPSRSVDDVLADLTRESPYKQEMPIPKRLKLDPPINLPPEPDRVEPKEKAVKPVKPPKPPKPPRQARKGSGAGKIWMIVALSLVVLAGIAGYLVLRMNAQDAPKKAAEAFAKAVFAGDVTTVMAGIETAGSGLSSADGVKKMCEDLRAVTDPTTFQKHLMGTLEEKDGAVSPELSCFSMKQTKDSLIAQEFQVKISGVQVLVEVDLEDVVLYVDGSTKPASTQASDGGLLLQLAPGSHTIEAFYEGYGQKDSLGSVSVESFATSEVQPVSVQKNIASAVIELAGTETNIKVSLNGSQAPIDAESGFIEINPAIVGMKITVKCDQYTQEFEVTTAGEQSFTVDYVAEQEAKNPTGQITDPLSMTNRQMMDHLSTRFYAFYASYLDAINQWNKALIKNASDAYYDEAVARMEAYNKGIIYKFYGVTFDRRSLRRVEKDGELYATFSVQPSFDYAYKEQAENWLKGGNSQVVTLHFNKTKSQWEVYGAEIVNDLAFSSNCFTIDA